MRNALRFTYDNGTLGNFYAKFQIFRRSFGPFPKGKNLVQSKSIDFLLFQCVKTRTLVNTTPFEKLFYGRVIGTLMMVEEYFGNFQGPFGPFRTVGTSIVSVGAILQEMSFSFKLLSTTLW